MPTSGHPVNYLYFISPFVVDSIFTALCFYKAHKIAQAGESTSVLRLFVRDGLLYFAVVSVANIVQTGFYIQPRAAMKVINAFAALGLSSMMCCRLVLSLKGFNNSKRSGRFVTGTNDTELSNRSGPKPPTFPILAKTEQVTQTDTASRSLILQQPTIDVTNVDLEKALSRKESTADTLNEKDVADDKVGPRFFVLGMFADFACPPTVARVQVRLERSAAMATILPSPSHRVSSFI